MTFNQSPEQPTKAWGATVEILKHHLRQTNLAFLVLRRKRLHRREGAGELLQGAGDREARSRSGHGENMSTVERLDK